MAIVEHSLIELGDQYCATAAAGLARRADPGAGRESPEHRATVE